MKSKVAVVVVVHPAYVRFLAAALASIEAQLSPFDEKVLVFDMGFDSCPPSISAPSDWKLVTGNWSNPNEARNAGICATGKVEWVCFWDADNRMQDNYLNRARPMLEAVDNRVAVLYPDVQQVAEDGSLRHRFNQPEWSFHGAQARSLCDSSSFWRMQALVEVNGFSRIQNGHDDYDLGLRIFRGGWRGKKMPQTVQLTMHGENRSTHRHLVQSLWTAWSYAFVTLWSGNRCALEVLEWLATADIPPRSTLYWVDNSGGKMTTALIATFAGRLRDRFANLVFIDAGNPYFIAPGERYHAVARHSHVAALYNAVLPRIREEIVVTLEDDTLPPHYGVRELLTLMRPFSSVGMAAGVYRSRTNPKKICAAIEKEKWRNVPDFDSLPDDPFEAGMTGGGFALIANWALQAALPMRCEVTSENRLMGWDGNLGMALSALGYKIMVHPKVKCRHLCQEVIDYEKGPCPTPISCPPDEYY